jgi:AmmeMemoRadiSam system protein B
MGYIREPAVSGTFYPDNPKILTKNIEAYLKNASFDAIEGEILGLISPHAGYMYSGQVAAYGYKAIMGLPYETVIVIAPSHGSRFESVAVLEKGGYRTPLGVVPIDEEFTGEIVNLQTFIRPNVDAHRGEHSLEVQVPFLQVVLKDFTIVPLIMGSQDPALCEALADCLHVVMKKTKKRVLIVGSTDLSHYYPYSEAVGLDTIVRQHLEAYDTTGLQDNLRKGTCEACGAGPIISTMLLSQKLGATQSKVLKYANSGDVLGDRNGVVGYISCVFMQNNLKKMVNQP